MLNAAVFMPRASSLFSSSSGSTPWRCASAKAIRCASCCVGCATAKAGTSANIQSRFLNFMRFYLGFLTPQRYKNPNKPIVF